MRMKAFNEREKDGGEKEKATKYGGGVGGRNKLSALFEWEVRENLVVGTASSCRKT